MLIRERYLYSTSNKVKVIVSGRVLKRSVKLVERSRKAVGCERR